MRKHNRLSFNPSLHAREYFDELCKRLTKEHRLGVRVTQREAFDRMVAYARKGELGVAHLLGKKSA